MKIYVASSYRNIPETREVIEILKLNGHSITHDWTLTENTLPPGFDEASGKFADFLYLCGVKDFEGVRACEGLVLVGHEQCRDAMAEFGMAIGQGKPTFVLFHERRKSVFYRCPGVVLCTGFVNLIRRIAEFEGRT